MDKEMMDKVNEILKKNSKRELSLDELDQVNGGGDINAPFGNEKELDLYVYTMIAGIEKSLGKDCANEFMRDTFHDSELAREYMNGDLDCVHNYLAQKFNIK